MDFEVMNRLMVPFCRIVRDLIDYQGIGRGWLARLRIQCADRLRYHVSDQRVFLNTQGRLIAAIGIDFDWEAFGMFQTNHSS